MTAKILAALAQLDTSNANHWTEDGLPRMDTVKLLAASPDLTREHVTGAAPGFSRTNPILQGAAQAPIAGSSGNGTDPGAFAAPAAQQPAAQRGDSDAAQAETQLEGADGDDTPESALEACEAELQAAQVKLGELAARKAVADQAHEAQVKEVDRLLQARDAALPKQSVTNEIQGYLAAQKRELEKRAAQQRQLGAALRDGQLKDLLTGVRGAPIDQAMARKNSRGAQRPQVPLK